MSFAEKALVTTTCVPAFYRLTLNRTSSNSQTLSITQKYTALE